MKQQLLGWLPLGIFWGLRLSGADVDVGLMLMLPSFSVGVFLSAIVSK